MAKSARSGYLSTRLIAAAAVALALAFNAPLCPAQEMAQGQGPAPRLASDPHADSHIAEAIRQVSAERIRPTIEKLGGFRNPSTISAEDDASIKAGTGIGAAREWIKAGFER